MQVMQHAHNFEVSSALITIILLGKYIEQYSKKKTVDKLSQLASLKVSKALLIEKEDHENYREIDVELVEEGDLIKVNHGQGVPVDGIVVKGKGLSNEAMLTGESKAVSKDIGSPIFGGSMLIQGSLIIRATKTAENSSLNQIIQLVENA